MLTRLISFMYSSHDSYRAQDVKVASVLTDKFEVYSPKVRFSRRGYHFTRERIASLRDIWLISLISTASRGSPG